jgi:hypothetical protein
VDSLVATQAPDMFTSLGHLICSRAARTLMEQEF